MPVSLISTKLHIPPKRRDIVPRPRLIQQLLRGLDQPGAFILVAGPPGFGKTTLLSEFADQFKGTVAWLSLDDGDNDPSRFWAYLIAALQTGQSGLGAAASAILLSPQPPPAETLAMLLINDLAELQHDLVLILDDYHVIHSDAIQSAFEILLERMPEKLHLVVSTRIDPPWSLARFRVRNRLVEIRAQDLRFTTDEAAAFLNQIMGLDLSASNIAALEGRTEGWIAGLQLAALSMKGRMDRSGFIQAFTGSNLYIAEYLIEEVLKQQPEERQRFLLQTSILDRLNAGLCEAVTGCEDGQSVLEALFHANLFVDSLDDAGEWFRYHPLFADLLKARLQRSTSKEMVRMLHRRAAAAYEGVGMTAEAVWHAIAAEDHPWAVKLVEKIAMPMIMEAHFKTVEDWLQAIPSEFLSERPRVNIALAWMHLVRRDFAKAGPYLERVERILSILPPDEVEPSLQGEWLALQSMLLNSQGKAVESRELALQALNLLPGDASKIRSLIYMGLAAAYQQTFEYERVEEVCAQIIRESRLAGDQAAEIFGLSYLGLTMIQQGKLHSAYETASGALSQIEQTGAFSPFSATLYGELAEVYYQWDQIEAARANYARSVELSLRGGFSDAEIYHSVFLSRLFQMEGNLPAALHEIENALDWMRTAAPTFVREEVIFQLVSILIALGRLSEACAALEPHGFKFEGGFTSPELEPGGCLSHEAGLLFNAALRILITQGAAGHESSVLNGAVELADRVIDGAMRSRHFPIALKTRLLKSQLYSVLGEREKGLLEAAKAVELAEPEGFICIFLEEGRPIADALTDLLQSHALDSARSAHVRRILAAFSRLTAPEASASTHPAWSIPGKKSGPDQELEMVEPLTQRELEVLRLIAEGDSNRVIAEKLVITVSAVKKHTGNIYGKLNVSSRTQALARARQLGLLPGGG